MTIQISNCDKTQKHKLQHKLETQIMTTLLNSKGYNAIQDLYESVDFLLVFKDFLRDKLFVF